MIMTTPSAGEVADLNPNVIAYGHLPTGSINASFAFPHSVQSGVRSARSLAVGLPAGAGWLIWTIESDVRHQPVETHSTDLDSTPVLLDDSRQSSSSAHVSSEVDAIRASELVSTAQNALSLSVTQIALIVGVARSTVYNWLKEIEVPRDEEKRTRLRGLARLSREWRQRSGETLGRLLEVPVGEKGTSLFSLMSASEWDIEAIHHTMDTLAENLRSRTEQRQQIAERSPNSVRDITPESIELERLRLRGLGR